MQGVDQVLYQLGQTMSAKYKPSGDQQVEYFKTYYCFRCYRAHTSCSIYKRMSVLEVTSSAYPEEIVKVNETPGFTCKKFISKWQYRPSRKVLITTRTNKKRGNK